MSMSDIKLAIRDNRTKFRPGESITGAAGWKLDKPPESVELRLFWRTEGKGTSDVTIIDTVKFDAPKQEEARPFSVTAPTAPHSFSGKLISLIWALELVALPEKETSRIDVVIAPEAREIVLHKTS